MLNKLSNNTLFMGIITIVLIISYLDISISSSIAYWILFFFPLIFTAWKLPERYSFVLAIFITILMLIGWDLRIVPNASKQILIINRILAIISIWMITISFAKHKDVVRNYNVNKDRLQGIVDSAMDAIITINSGQKIVVFNKAAEKMFRVDSVSVINTDINRFLPEELKKVHSKHIQNFGQTGETNRKMGQLGILKAVREDKTEFPIEASISQIENGGQKYFTVILRDITERKKAENALLESENRFKVLANTAPVLIWIMDDDQKASFFNSTWLTFTGKRIEEEIGFGWIDGVQEEDREFITSILNDSFKNRKECFFEFRLLRKDQKYRWMFNQSIPRFTVDNEFQGFIGSCIDITERKEAEEFMVNSLKEKDILIKEVHHRVKNNLQIIISLLNLQSSYIKNPHLLGVLIESQNRIKSMALIHEKLYQSTDLAHIDFSNYITDLAQRLFMTYRLNNTDIQFLTDIEQIDLDIDIAISLGLIINEIFTNSLKYAFPPKWDRMDEEKAIKVSLKAKNEHCEIIISDNGVGLPETVNLNKTETLGLQLVTTLIEQISGTIELNVSKGTSYKITLKNENN